MILLQRTEHPRWLSNTYLLADRPGGTGVLVDAGGPAGPVLRSVKESGLRVAYILLTHRHHDHVAEAAALAAATGARLAAHEQEAPHLPTPVHSLADGERLTAGDLTIEVLHIPGHTAGQAAYRIDGDDLFPGDTLFRGSVGGTVGPGATGWADLRHSLLERLLALPDRLRVHPGHREGTTIGRERSANPFLRVMDGRDPEGNAPCRVAGRPARLVVWARDYDGGYKAWVRYDDGGEDVAPGSRVERR